MLSNHIYIYTRYRPAFAPFIAWGPVIDGSDVSLPAAPLSLISKVTARGYRRWMCICIRLNACACAHGYVYVHVYLYVYVYVYTSKYMCMCAWICVVRDVHGYGYMYVHLCMRVCICIYVCVCRARWWCRPQATRCESFYLD